MAQNLFPSTIPNIANDPVLVALDGRSGVEVDAASGAIAIKVGTVYITKAGVAAMTLAAPVAGLPSAGGDDGKTLTIVSTTANAHTVTTPASTIDNTLHIATMSATLPNVWEIKAYNGVWYSVVKLGVTTT